MLINKISNTINLTTPITGIETLIPTEEFITIEIAIITNQIVTMDAAFLEEEFIILEQIMVIGVADSINCLKNFATEKLGLSQKSKRHDLKISGMRDSFY